MSSGRIWAKNKVKQIAAYFCQAPPPITLSMTHMGQMTNSTQFIIIIWTWQEMMVWMSMELIGSLDVIW
jgi:hypothetical protein